MNVLVPRVLATGKQTSTGEAFCLKLLINEGTAMLDHSGQGVAKVLAGRQMGLAISAPADDGIATPVHFGSDSPVGDDIACQAVITVLSGSVSPANRTSVLDLGTADALCSTRE
jgi:hypothetical protein